MNNKDLFNGIGGIDEELLKRSEQAGIDSAISHKNTARRILPIAACFCLLAAAAVPAIIKIRKNKDVIPVVDETETSAYTNRTPQTELPTETATVGETASAPQTTAENETVTESTAVRVPEETRSESVSSAENIPSETTGSPSEITSAGEEGKDKTKGGDTDDFLQTHNIGSDGCYYKIFIPGVDVFDPVDEMTLENRFCSFTYGGRNYYPAPDGGIAAGEYEEDVFAVVKAVYQEIRSANADDEVAGIEYHARIELHRIPGTDPADAVACGIFFNGESKTWKYLGSAVITPSFP